MAFSTAPGAILRGSLTSLLVINPYLFSSNTGSALGALTTHDFTATALTTHGVDALATTFASTHQTVSKSNNATYITLSNPFLNDNIRDRAASEDADEQHASLTTNTSLLSAHDNIRIDSRCPERYFPVSNGFTCKGSEVQFSNVLKCISPSLLMPIGLLQSHGSSNNDGSLQCAGIDNSNAKADVNNNSSNLSKTSKLDNVDGA